MRLTGSELKSVFIINRTSHTYAAVTQICFQEFRINNPRYSASADIEMMNSLSDTPGYIHAFYKKHKLLIERTIREIDHRKYPLTAQEVSLRYPGNENSFRFNSVYACACVRVHILRGGFQGWRECGNDPFC